VKVLTGVLAVALAAAGVTDSALAQSNDATFKQTQGDDGQIHMELSVGYGFPGLPPRTANSGVGTVRVTLPGASFRLESVDPGYNCIQAGGGESITCSAEGQPQAGGTAFPASMTVRLVSASCWTGPAGSADIWAAPTDPGGSPDVSLPVQPGGCAADPGNQPVQDTKESCKVPNVKKMTLVAAKRELKAGDCALGKVKFAASPTVKKGRVISQSQRPGKTLPAAAKVNLVVSRGKKR
jgi:PASTA domain-containing protein